MSNPLYVFKYGGNAMTNEALKKEVLRNIFQLHDAGNRVVIVHGGGPFIQKVLDDSGIESEFIGGHRKTTPEALPYVEMALKGLVNGSIVGIANQLGYTAVGLSGKDGRMATAALRKPSQPDGDDPAEADLGRVGDITQIDTTVIRLLLESNIIPVITCIVPDEQGHDLNVNADMFAGAIAGALEADAYVVLTDVDGLLRDKDDPSTLIEGVRLEEIDALVASGVIQGGMIPKMEACCIAVANGAKSARIINGTMPDTIRQFMNTTNGTGIYP